MSEHIFIADDDPDIVQFVSVNLQLEGYEVSSAIDGKAALAAITDQAPDLVTDQARQDTAEEQRLLDLLQGYYYDVEFIPFEDLSGREKALLRSYKDKLTMIR